MSGASPPPSGDDLRRRFAATPVYELLGIRLERCDADEVVVGLDVGPVHANLDRALHGGIVALLADTAMGLSARLAVAAGARNRTLDVTLRLQGAASIGDTVRCSARVSHRTRRLVWTTCLVRHAVDGRPIAEGSALHFPADPRGSEGEVSAAAAR